MIRALLRGSANVRNEIASNMRAVKRFGLAKHVLYVDARHIGPLTEKGFALFVDQEYTIELNGRL